MNIRSLLQHVSVAHVTRYWNNCLDVVAWQVHQRAARWWFHLYQLVQSHLQPPTDVSDQVCVGTRVDCLVGEDC